MVKEESPDIAEVLGRIRARLRAGIEVDLRPRSAAAPDTEFPSENVEGLRERMAAIRNAHRQVGTVNPRHPGLINNLIQAFKRSMRRSLSWYTRPIVEFQDHTLHFLSETTGILGREQERFAHLEKRIVGIAAELAELRQQFGAKLDGLSTDLDRLKQEREQLRAEDSIVEGSRER